MGESDQWFPSHSGIDGRIRQKLDFDKSESDYTLFCQLTNFLVILGLRAGGLVGNSLPFILSRARLAIGIVQQRPA